MFDPRLTFPSWPNRYWRGLLFSGLILFAVNNVLLLPAAVQAQSGLAQRATALQIQGAQFTSQKKWLEATAVYTQCIEAYRELSRPADAALCLNSRAYSLTQSGKAQEGVADYVQSAKIFREMSSKAKKGSPSWRLSQRGYETAIGGLARSALADGDYDQAVKLFALNYEILEELADENPAGRAYLQQQLGEIATTRGDHSAAAKYYRSSAELYDKSNSVYASAGIRATREKMRSAAELSQRRVLLTDLQDSVAGTEPAPIEKPVGGQNSLSQQSTEPLPDQMQFVQGSEQEIESSPEDLATIAEEFLIGIEREWQNTLGPLTEFISPSSIFFAIAFVVVGLKVRSARKGGGDPQRFDNPSTLGHRGIPQRPRPNHPGANPIGYTKKSPR